MIEVVFSIEDDSPEGATSVFITVPFVPRIGETVKFRNVTVSDFGDPETADEELDYFLKQGYHFKKFIVQFVEWNLISSDTDDDPTYVNISLKELNPVS